MTTFQTVYHYKNAVLGVFHLSFKQYILPDESD